ncbi:MAG: hypothetical protein U1E14_21495, partial [Geminicoccaceae bacterium]
MNDKRRRAVEMRLAGASLAAVRAETGLSAPTVIGAFKAFRAGGWQAVPIKSLGRLVGQGRRLSAEQERELLHTLGTRTPAEVGLARDTWSVDAAVAFVRMRFDRALSASTLQRYLDAWGLDLAPLREARPETPDQARWLEQDLPRQLSRARARRARIVWVGQVGVGEPPARLLCAASVRGHPSWLPAGA